MLPYSTPGSDRLRNGFLAGLIALVLLKIYEVKNEKAFNNSWIVNWFYFD